jgi:hypothetical protein
MIRLVYFVTPNPYKKSKDKRELISVYTGEDEIYNLAAKVAELNIGREFWQGRYEIVSSAAIEWNEIPVK